MFRTPICSAEGAGRSAEARTAPLRSPLSALRSQEGFTLAALIVILTIISIIVAFTVPTQWSLVMKRERDRQTIFYMKQYARAILAWQMKHNNTVPTSLEQLREARKPRLIRGADEWPCPLTGKKEDWILVPPQALQPANAPGAQQGGLPFPNREQQEQQRRQQQQQQQQQQLQPGQTQPAMKLNKELSPPDYKGPFVAVRPKFEGESFIELNGASDYSEWVYTVDDLRNEIAQRQAALLSR